jgi:hypothetical protein
MELVRRDHGVVYKDRVVHVLNSVYTTPWSLLTSFIHETIDHSVYTSWSLLTRFIHETMDREETMVLYRQIEWSLVSCMKLVRRDHGVV